MVVPPLEKHLVLELLCGELNKKMEAETYVD